ncbi:MAG: DUF4132 domain-containing protein [Planctomycetaceae bacterium]|jgi:hypothetical protein|nr:DUF4132 domain-containing protein [Planctomycetaceae bacterium]
MMSEEKIKTKLDDRLNEMRKAIPKLKKENQEIAKLFCDVLSDKLQNKPQNKAKLFQRLTEGKNQLDEIFAGSRAELIPFLFSKENDNPKRFEKLWSRLPIATYQTGWNRRSFRTKKQTLLYLNKCFSLICDFFRANVYGCTLETYFEYGIKLPQNIYASVSSQTPVKALDWHNINVTLAPQLIALALDENDDFVKSRIKEIIYSDDNSIGLLTREIVRGVLLSRNADAHKMIGDLLLAAKLQEGLRQTIVESCDECSIEGFQYIIKLILDNNLERFSSIVRAIGSWMGLQIAEFRPKAIRKTLELATQFIANSPKNIQLPESDDLVEFYVALWGIGSREIGDTRKLLFDLVKSTKKYKRVAALHFLNQTGDTQLMKEIVFAILDEDDLEIWTQLLGITKRVIDHELNVRVESGLQREADPKKVEKKKQKVSEDVDDLDELEDGLDVDEYYFSGGFLMRQLMNGDISVGQSRLNDDVIRTLFNRLRQLAESTPKKETRFEPDAFHEYIRRISADNFIALMISCVAMLGRKDDDVQILMSLLPKMDMYTKVNLIDTILTFNNPKHRAALIELFCDLHLGWNQDKIIAKFKNARLTPEEYEKIEDALRFKDANFRIKIINQLLTQSPEGLQKSIERLLHAKEEQKRLAGLDLIDQAEKLAKEKKEYVNVVSVCKKIAVSSAGNENKKGTKKSAAENILVQKFAEKKTNEYSKENGFGLCNPNGKPNIPEPKKSKTLLADLLVEKLPRFEKILKELDDLIHENKDYEYTGYRYWTSNEKQDFILGSQDDFFATIISREEREKLRGGNPSVFYLDDYPLADVWRGLLERQIKAEEVLLLYFFTSVSCNYSFGDFERFCKGEGEFEKYASFFKDWFNSVCWNYKKMQYLVDEIKNKKYRYTPIVLGLINVFFNEIPAEKKSDFITDILSGTYHATPKNLFTQQCSSLMSNIPHHNYRIMGLDENYKLTIFDRDNILLRELFNTCRSINNQIDFQERFNILYKFYETSEYSPNLALNIEILEKARELNLIDDEELLREMLIRPNHFNVARNIIGHGARYRRYQHHSPKKEYPNFKRLLPNVIERILEIELKRGDSETEVSDLATCITEFEGIRYFVAILQAMDETPFERGYSYSNVKSRSSVFCSLLKACEPEANADPKQFAGIPEQRLLEAAMYAPQWIDLVQEFLGWNGLTSACWYFHAHINETMDETKESIIARYSPITPQRLKDGAFDIDWFNDAYKTVGEKRFQMIYNAAKYITSGNNHRRAQIFADAIRGKLKIEEIRKSVVDKRNKDNLLAYSLLPFKKGKAEKEQLERYNFIQKFLKEGKKFGQQRKESEGKICEIALENLARAAGFDDVNRFIWAMETEKSKELAKYIVPKKIDGFELSVQIDEFGKPAIRSLKEDGSELKDIPTKLKKHSYVDELKEVIKTFRDQFRSVRTNFEKSMENGSEFTADELSNLSQNPVIFPIISKLVYCANGAFGFFAEGKLVDVDGKISVTKKLKASDRLVISHPVHLFESKTWKLFQKIVFEREIVQPFKQVFRELYLPNADEKKSKTCSNRYAGHQVQPRKMVALLKGRNWTIDQLFGFQKVFYKYDVLVRLYCYADWFMPSDIESPSIEKIEFVDRRSLKVIPLMEIPPVIFSEVMRDLDLVVSVAHVGGVDPEASLSTVEMRLAILDETLRLLKLKNVAIKKSHVLIKGTLGEYSVHLGSGEVQIMAGGSLTILPVHSQQRGRIFLPFIDDDPKTAEIMSKTLLLAEDNKIKDPTILAAIRDK